MCYSSHAVPKRSCVLQEALLTCMGNRSFVHWKRQHRASANSKEQKSADEGLAAVSLDVRTVFLAAGCRTGRTSKESVTAGRPHWRLLLHSGVHETGQLAARHSCARPLPQVIIPPFPGTTNLASGRENNKAFASKSSSGDCGTEKKRKSIGSFDKRGETSPRWGVIQSGHSRFTIGGRCPSRLPQRGPLS